MGDPRRAESTGDVADRQSHPAGHALGVLPTAAEGRPVAGARSLGRSRLVGVPAHRGLLRADRSPGAPDGADLAAALLALSARRGPRWTARLDLRGPQ